MPRGVIGDRIARCAAHTSGGKPCKNAPIKGGAVCHKHGGSAPQVRRKANERIAFAADPAAAYLVSVMYDDTMQTKDRMKAAAFLLDRSGAAGPEPQAEPLWQTIASRIFTSGETGPVQMVYGDEILDAEVVDDQPFTDDELDDRPREIEPRRQPARYADDEGLRPDPISEPRYMDGQGVVQTDVVNAAEFSDLPPAYDKAGRKLAQGDGNARWER